MNLHQANILIVDDDKDVLTAVRFLLKMEVKTILTETNPENIHKLIMTNDIDIVMLDMNFRSSINTGNEGIFWLKEIKKWKPAQSVIMITAYADIDLAIKSLKEGAADFIVKPWDNQKLVETLQTAATSTHNDRKTASKEKPVHSPMYWGESKVMQQLRALIERLPSPMPTS